MSWWHMGRMTPAVWDSPYVALREGHELTLSTAAARPYHRRSQ
jgi:hypothetical protein